MVTTVMKLPENKRKTWSRGTNSRLPFGVNVNLNLSITKNVSDGKITKFS